MVHKARLAELLAVAGRDQAGLLLGEPFLSLRRRVNAKADIPQHLRRLVWVWLRLLTEPDRPITLLEAATMGRLKVDPGAVGKATRFRARPVGKQFLRGGPTKFQGGDGI